MTASTTHRIEDTIVVCTIETHSAAVPFNTLLAAVQIEPDDYAEPFEKGTVMAHNLKPLNDAALPEQARAAVWTRREGFRFIELEDDGRELFDFYRAHGAARQVAAELCAQDKRRTLDAIATIYKNDTAGYGLDIWNVSLAFNGYSADLGNVEGLDYAQSEAAQELAIMVAGDMEATGYTITGKPNLSAQRLAYRQERFKNNVYTQNWQ